MADTGEDPKAASESVEAIFNALPKTKQREFLGGLNEVLVYIAHHLPKKEA